MSAIMSQNLSHVQLNGAKRRRFQCADHNFMLMKICMASVPWTIIPSCLWWLIPLQHSFSHHKVYYFTFNLNFGINKWSFKLIKNVMAVFPLFAPFRIYKNIHTQNFADNYLMLMPSVHRCIMARRRHMSAFSVVI